MNLAAAPSSAASASPGATPLEDQPDPNLWLEAVDAPDALAWVRERNASSRARLEADPRFATLRQQLRDILDSQDRIPAVSRRGQFLYNLWRDSAHPRGLWRRTRLESFRQHQPDWETVLDLDALARAEQENWVWSSPSCLGGESPRCMIHLSRGGADATVAREFDLERRAFVPDGFCLPEAKTWISWLDADTLLVSTDTGPGSLTDSGYPREVRLWRRGTALAEAPVLLRGETSDVTVGAVVHHDIQPARVVLTRSLDFYRQRHWIWTPGDASADAGLRAVDVPQGAVLGFWREQLVLQLRQDWGPRDGGPAWPAGSLLVGPEQACLDGRPDALVPVFTPSATRALQGWTASASHLVLDVLDTVHNRVEICAPGPRGWTHRQLAIPASSLSVQALHDPQVAGDPLAEHLLVSGSDFLIPDTLYLADTSGQVLEPLKSRPRFFDAQGMSVAQHFATSKDGTRVPYFVVRGRGAEAAAGPRPTLLYGYGGFEVPLLPWYLAGTGRAWLERGGVFVLANIRGGSEFGPGWHQAAILENKQRSYDDFIAVAEALIAQGITTPPQLGIQGGSNGGLLVGAVMVQRPELFGAVVCQVPLLDMRRYHLLLAGASWMAEYGNPDDPAQWAFIRRYSPYQNVRAGVRYPAIFINTSTRDDRVHPGHARKMAARMLAQGHEVLYHEHIEGGHGGGADNAQQADRQALEYTFLWQRLGGR